MPNRSHRPAPGEQHRPPGAWLKAGMVQAQPPRRSRHTPREGSWAPRSTDRPVEPAVPIMAPGPTPRRAAVGRGRAEQLGEANGWSPLLIRCAMDGLAAVLETAARQAGEAHRSRRRSPRQASRHRVAEVLTGLELLETTASWRSAPGRGPHGRAAHRFRRRRPSLAAGRPPCLHDFTRTGIRQGEGCVPRMRSGHSGLRSPDE